MITKSPDRPKQSQAPGATPGRSVDLPPMAKVFALLEVLSQRGSARLTDLADALGVPKTTLHRITSQLEELGYLQREPGGRRLTIAPRLAGLAADMLGASLKLAPRHAILEQLAIRLGESCSVGIRIGHDVVYLDDVAGSSPLAYNFQTGRRSPLYCTSTGKLFLARMNADELDRYFRSEELVAHTPNSITDKSRLREVINEVRGSGFASTDNEFVVGVIGAAVPIVDADGRLLAGLAVSIPAARMSFAELPKLQPAMVEAAEALAQSF